MSVKSTVASTRSGSASSQPPDLQTSSTKCWISAEIGSVNFPNARWPAPGISTTRAVGIREAMYSGTSGATTVSSDPRMISVGTCTDGRHGAHVDLPVHPVERLDRAGAGAVAEVVDEARQLVAVELTELAHRLLGLLTRAEDAQVPLDLAPELLLGAAPWIVGRPHPPWNGAPHHESRRALGIRGGEEDGHRRALGEAVETPPASSRPHP